MGKGSRRRKRVGSFGKTQGCPQNWREDNVEFKANLIPSDGGMGDAFAFSLSISGNTIAVGSLFHPKGSSAGPGVA
jgi:FG-GAP repeat